MTDKKRFYDSNGNIKDSHLYEIKKSNLILKLIKFINKFIFDPKIIFELPRHIRTYYVGKKIKFIERNNYYKNNNIKYDEYIKIQLTHASYGSIQKNSKWKVQYFMPTIEKYYKSIGYKKSVLKILCIGCRSMQEIDEFINSGFKDVEGIDLYSIDSRIKIMDMHCMDYEDNTMDCIYMADSLEHAYDVTKVVSEVIRIAKDKSLVVIRIPFDHPADSVRHPTDIKNPEYLYSIFDSKIDNILLKEIESGGNQPVLDTVVSIKK